MRKSCLRALCLLMLVACTAPIDESLVVAPCVDAPAPDAVLPADATPPTPPPNALVLLLHGVGATGPAEQTYWQASGVPNVVILAPSSHLNEWNASVACCDNSLSQPDEATLVTLVTDRIALGDIDPARVYVMGHSNGGFMTWRLLCDHGDLFRAGVTFEGSANAPGDPACTPSRPVHILHVHGSLDSGVSYDLPNVFVNRMLVAPVPAIGPLGSADQESVAAACTNEFRSNGQVSATIVMLNATTPATVDWFTRDCAGFADFWRVNGGVHSPLLTAAWFPNVLAWAESHR